MAIPLIPEKVDAWKAWVHELLGPQRKEFDDFNERFLLTAHRVWVTEGPQGPMVIAILEGPGTDLFLNDLAISQHPFDTWFRERISEYHGIDFSQPGSAPSSELLVDWHARELVDVSA
ncbi:MAG: hypothetical protein A2Y76_03880 [Planctomycetes bacterium RBG_13_60_9]|nr:MAG: hypothetical protein A2Y76_03880 [Planctomycetes bacterium RBG_13_60_9]